jgi:hypothetical protein
LSRLWNGPGCAFPGHVAREALEKAKMTTPEIFLWGVIVVILWFAAGIAFLAFFRFTDSDDDE